MNTVWKTKFHLDVFNVNHQGRSDHRTFFNFMQECALKHAQVLGFGSKDLLDKDLLWVVTRFELEVYDQLNWDDEIIITTWSRGLIGPYAFRDFLINKTSNGLVGDVMAKASSSWIPINTSTRKSVILNPKDLNPSTIHNHSVGIDPRKIFYRVEKNNPLITYEVRNSDLDINAHVNNCKYIQWIYDALTIEELEKLSKKNFTINYLNEAKLGDTILIYRNDHDFQAVNYLGKTIFNAHFF